MGITAYIEVVGLIKSLWYVGALVHRNSRRGWLKCSDDVIKGLEQVMKFLKCRRRSANILEIT